MNDEGLANFDAIAVVEPYIFEEPDTGKPHTGYYRHWQVVMPTVHRTDGHPRHSFRAIIWVNHKLRITQIPVQSYDITAALIYYPEGPKLIVVAYDSNDNTNHATTRAEVLQENLQLTDSTIRASRQEHGQDLSLLSYSDMNRHHPLCGGLQVGDHHRQEADDMVEMALDLQFQSLVQPGTITWEHQARDLQSTVDVIFTDATYAKRWWNVESTMLRQSEGMERAQLQGEPRMPLLSNDNYRRREHFTSKRSINRRKHTGRLMDTQRRQREIPLSLSCTRENTSLDKTRTKQTC